MLLLQAILDDRSRLLLTGGGGRLGVAWMQRLAILGLWLESTDQLLSLLATRLVSFLLGVPRRRTGTDTAEGVKRSALAAAVVAAGGRHCFDVNFGERKGFANGISLDLVVSLSGHSRAWIVRAWCVGLILSELKEK